MNHAAPIMCRVIDLETTGFPENEAAEIIEFGRYDVREAALGDGWTTLIKPRGPIPPETKAIHHITEEDVANAPEARDVWGLFFDGLGDGDVIVAHKAQFAMHFLGETGSRWRWIDTFKVARVVWPDAPGHSNQVLRYWLELPCDADEAWPPHRALPDACVTAHLLIRLMSEKTIEEMVKISTYPALAHKITFGKKHKGWAYADTPTDYLQWIRDQSDMDEDTKFSAGYWLKKRGAR